MKFIWIVASLLMCQLASAQSMKEKRDKQKMLDRVEVLIEKIEATQEDLKNEDVINACVKIKEMFILYPDHLKAIGSRLDLYQSRTVRAKEQALEQLIFMHRQSLICSKGKDSEFVDPKAVRKELKEIEKSLKKQRKTIKKSDTDHENNFYYQYEF